MKKLFTYTSLMAILFLMFAVVMTGCKKEDKNTIIKGTASFLAGSSGDLSNSKISLYTTYDNWVNNQPIRFQAMTGAGASVSFELKDVLPGNYYLDIWKDIDNSATWTVGDFVGWYGSGGLGSPQLTEFQITDGQTIEMVIQMYILAKKDPTPK